MAEAWDSEFVTQAFGYLLALSTEFTKEWESNDMRATIFKVLLGWIVLSVTAIHLAWKCYGPTVNNIYYRQGSCCKEIRNSLDNAGCAICSHGSLLPRGMGGQNGGTPEYPSNFPMWESLSTESLKTHQE